MKINLNQNCWYGDEKVQIDFPEDWEVEYHGLEGDACSELSDEQIREKINSPYGMKSLAELARDRKEVAIVFDDISRGTPVKKIAEIVLEELHAAGISEKNVRFICALGTHGAHTRIDFEKKLGSDIVRKYPVFNHNSYENCVEIGRTKRDFPVLINEEFMKCDLKIGIGAVTPHPFNGFGGGGKMLFPGIASIDTIQQNHATAVDSLEKSGINPITGMGNINNRGMREEIEEMTKMVGEFFKIDVIYNSKLEIVDLYAGDAVEEYYASIDSAKKLYGTSRPKEKDVVVVNANAKANEAAIALFFGAMGVSGKGGDLVLVNHTPTGQITHYLFGAFGKTTGGRMWSRLPVELPHINRIIYYTPYPDYSSAMWFGDPERITWATTWQEVMDIIGDNGKGTKVSVIADGTIQYYKENND
ncbi:Nickel-dependent lactate racemase [Dethiosulfatibacter aminovorans DSM 17477]|uniref:Nickel-dependent lactate racemase n=1 Tax=Dethiosulfatibacter aminovorans DSM 17477 TaxID=1121476 RepID=A0A1M6EJE0_9FIRM|nr:lactate racemase domain-containing protein [Dethiosulfatibacter aminovorans]SHI85573.1 Nickel-dependent lactate racemase [Dethiosulfatibacter aminovorans DSM 17477]